MIKLRDLVPKGPLWFDGTNTDISDAPDDVPLAVKYWCYICGTANAVVFLFGQMFAQDHETFRLVFGALLIIAPFGLLFTWRSTVQNLKSGLPSGMPGPGIELCALSALIGSVAFAVFIVFIPLSNS